MRALALFLILANLCFLGWATLIDTPQTEPGVSTVASTSSPRLLLATERPSATTPEAQPPTTATEASGDSAPPAATTASLTCISVGPYQDLAGASQASASLQGAGFNTRQRLEQGEIWVGYWVSVPNLATSTEAEQALARLKAGGIADAYVLSGNQSNTISLGVFSELPRAQRRMDEARQLGFEPQLADRKREGALYWLDVELNEPGQLIDPALLQSSGTIVRLETRACPAA